MKYRLDLTLQELEALSNLINGKGYVSELAINNIKEMLFSPTEIKKSNKKILAADKATQARTNKAKEKIQNAVNILRMENKEFTHYAIAKTSGASFNTVKKYITDDDLTSLNEKR